MASPSAPPSDLGALDPDEEGRLESLRLRDIVGTPPEDQYDGLARAAAAIAETPYALVTLVDADRVWCKARVGLDIEEAPRSTMFCSAAIVTPDEPLIVPNATEDPRFSDLPLVAGPPHIRSYAGFVLRDAEGRGLGTICVLDVTERTFTSEQIDLLAGLAAVGRQLLDQRVVIADVRRRRQASELFEVGFENTNVGMQILTTDGRYLRVNRAFADMIGVAQHELVGRNWREFTHESDRPAPGIEAEILAGIRSSHREVKRYVRSDGSVVWGVVNVVPVRIDGETDERIHFTQVIDISDTVAARDRAEGLAERLAGEERRFRLALQHAPIGVVLMSPTGDFIDANAAMLDLIGRDRAEVLGSSVTAMTHPDDREELQAILEGLGGTDRSSDRRELRFVGADGAVHEVLVAVSIVDTDDDPYLIGQIVDIGERKRAERAQQEAIEHQGVMVRRLLELDQMKSNLVSNVSHELRTPLTSILGYLELLQDDETGSLSEQQHRLLGVAARNGERLLQVVENLLTSSHLRSEGLQPDMADVSVRELVETTVATMRPIAKRAGVELSVTIDTGIGTIDGDQELLERVLTNLASNAIKFTPAGGTVVISASVGATDVFLRVTDTGVGIPLDEQQFLFTRFFRTTLADEQAIPGTGLGLSITAELVQAHDGEIEIESSEGEGTTVLVRLPRRHGNREAAPPAEVPER